MSRKLFAFLLSELENACVVCGKCKVRVEMPITELGQKYQGMSCPFCGTALITKGPQNANPFASLAHAAQEFKRFAEQVQIEFLLPDKES
jgi:DNA-directed RNA polymerase subunit RPC12/RpoP